MLVRIWTALVLLFLLLPIFIVIPISFSSAQYLTFPPPGFSLQWYENFFTNSQWVDAVVKSFEVGLWTTLLSVILGTMAAMALTKGDFPGKQVLQNIFLLPMVVPSIIVAIAVYKLYSQIGLTGTVTGLVIAHTLLAMPVVIVSVLSSLRSMDPNLEFAAMNLGASPLQTFFRVTLHVIKPAIASGAFFAFITSFDELIITIFISGTSSTTLPKQMWDGIRNQIDPTVAAVSSILIVSSMAILLIYQLTSQRSKTQVLEASEN